MTSVAQAAPTKPREGMSRRFSATFRTRASVETTTIVRQRLTQASVVSPKFDRNMKRAAGISTFVTRALAA